MRHKITIPWDMLTKQETDKLGEYTYGCLRRRLRRKQTKHEQSKGEHDVRE